MDDKLLKEYLEEQEIHSRKTIKLLEELVVVADNQKQQGYTLQEKIDLLIEKKVKLDLPDVILTKEQEPLPFPEKQKVEIDNWQPYPDKVKLERPEWWKDPEKFPEKIEVSNLPPYPQFPKKIDLKKPDWYKEATFDTKPLEKTLTGLFRGLWEAIKANISKTFITNKKPSEAIPVIPYTEKGEPFQIYMSGGGSGGGTADNVGILNRLALKSKAISVSSSGNNEVVAAVAGKSIKVYAVKFNVASAVSAKWVDGVTDLEGAMPYGAREGHTESVTPPMFLFQTTAGNALNLDLSDGVAATGRVSYWED